MQYPHFYLFLVFVLATVLSSKYTAHAQSLTQWQSEIVFEGMDGRLVYVSDADSNRIPDFSHAGYGGGGVDIPFYPVTHTISPIPGDNSEHIQQAIDFVSGLAPDGEGIRGALLLEAGIYEVSQTLNILQNGIVLRGEGNGPDSTSNTIIRRIGTSQDPVLRIGNNSQDDAWAEVENTRSDITSPFVSVGSRSFTVENPGLYSIGDQIIVLHPLTDAWIAAVDGGGTDTDPAWETDEFDIAYTRRIEDIQDDRIYIDAPVFNHLDRSLTQSYVYKRDNTGEIREVGIENLRITIDTESRTSENHARSAIEFVHVANGWARTVTSLHFVYAGIDVRRSIHVTVKDSEALEPHSQIEGGRRYNFATFRSQLVLFENNLATEARHAYVGNGEAWDSGIVFLNSISQDAITSSEPHRHWGQGFLYDNHEEIGSPLRSRRLLLGNRGRFGTSHGWSAVHSVAWNCKMNRTTASIQKPPTAQNYAIGCEGNITGEGPFSHPTGYIEGSNTPDLYPESLYIKQLEDRGKSVANVANEPIPKRPAPFILHGNAPNPFNATTTITYSLSSTGHVKLEVFDILGRSVALLIDEQQHPGTFTETFDGSQLPSGMYIYRITTNGFARSKYLTVVKH